MRPNWYERKNSQNSKRRSKNVYELARIKFTMIHRPMISTISHSACSMMRFIVWFWKKSKQNVKRNRCHRHHQAYRGWMRANLKHWGNNQSHNWCEYTHDHANAHTHTHSQNSINSKTKTKRNEIMRQLLNQKNGYRLFLKRKLFLRHVYVNINR